MNKMIVTLLVSFLAISTCVRKEIQTNPYEKEDFVNDLFLLPVYMCQGYQHFQNKKDGKSYVPDGVDQNDACQQFNQFDSRFKNIVKDLPEVTYKNELQYNTIKYVFKILTKYVTKDMLIETAQLPHYAALIADTCEDYLSNIPNCSGFESFKSECHMKYAEDVSGINQNCNQMNYRVNSSSIINQATGMNTKQLDEGQRWSVVDHVYDLKSQQTSTTKLSQNITLDGFNILGGLLYDCCNIMEDQCNYYSFTKYVSEKCRAAAIGCKRQDYQYYEGIMNKNEQQSALRIIGRIENEQSKHGGQSANVFNECYTLRDLCIRQMKVGQCSWMGCHPVQWKSCWFRCNDWLNQFVDECNHYIFNDREGSSICDKYKEEQSTLLGSYGEDDQAKKDELMESAYISFMH